MPTCPECQGTKGEMHFDVGSGSPSWWIGCHLCGGAGEVDDATIARFERGKQLRAERIARDKGLRETATEQGLTPTQLSKIERGVMDPP